MFDRHDVENHKRQLMGLTPTDRDPAAPITFVTTGQISNELQINRRNSWPAHPWSHPRRSVMNVLPPPPRRSGLEEGARPWRAAPQRLVNNGEGQ